MSIETRAAVDRSSAEWETLPATRYSDPQAFAQEEESIFHRCWQYVGLVSEIPEPGDFFTHRVGRTPVIVVRDRELKIRVFVNVCRHRGAELVEPGACGNRTTLQCPYHAWTYGLDGKLRGAPRAKANADFDMAGIALHELRAETLGPLIFANPDVNAAGVDEVFGPWMQEMNERGIDFPTGMRVRSKHDFPVTANWKINCDNGPECYHCPTVHPSLLERRDGRGIPEFVYELHDDYSIHGYPPDPTFVPGFAFRGGVQLSFLFPNLFPSMYPGGFMTILQILPLDATHSIYHRQYWMLDGDQQEKREQSLLDYSTFLEQLDHEDVSIAESVQRATTSGFYDRGHFMLPNSDVAVQWFQRRVQTALSVALDEGERD